MKIQNLILFLTLILSGCVENQKIEANQEMCLECDDINDRAVEFLKNGDTLIALSIFDSLNKTNPEYIIAFSNKAFVLEEMGSIDSAIAIYSHCIEYDNEYKEARFNRGALYSRIGKDELAFEDYMVAYELGFQNQALFNDLSISFRNKKDYNFALELINKALDINDSFATAHNTKAIILTDMNRLEQALSSSNIAIQLDSNSESFYNNRAIIYNQLNNYQMAIQDCEKAIQINEKYPYAYNTLGMSMDGLNKYTTGIGYYSKAIELKPGFKEATFNMGVSYLQSGDSVKACEMLKQAFNLGGDYRDNKYYDFYNNCK
jgi:tetratricopeptide (TPR) repeat protein